VALSFWSHRGYTDSSSCSETDSEEITKPSCLSSFLKPARVRGVWPLLEEQDRCVGTAVRCDLSYQHIQDEMGSVHANAFRLYLRGLALCHLLRGRVHHDFCTGHLRLDSHHLLRIGHLSQLQDWIPRYICQGHGGDMTAFWLRRDQSASNRPQNNSQELLQDLAAGGCRVDNSLRRHCDQSEPGVLQAVQGTFKIPESCSPALKIKATRVVKIVKIVRLFKIVKMLRIVKIPSQLRHLETMFNKGVLRLITFFSAAILITHLCACFFYYSSYVDGFDPVSQKNTEIGLHWPRTLG